jgi:hypothetical protein
LLQPCRSARVWLRDFRIQAFRKDLSGTSSVRTAETPYRQAHPDTAAMGRHIPQIPLIPPMEPTGKAATARALRPLTAGMGRYDHLIRSDRDVIHDKAGRQQPISLPSFGHELLPSQHVAMTIPICPTGCTKIEPEPKKDPVLG